MAFSVNTCNYNNKWRCFVALEGIIFEISENCLFGLLLKLMNGNCTFQMSRFKLISKWGHRGLKIELFLYSYFAVKEGHYALHLRDMCVIWFKPITIRDSFRFSCKLSRKIFKQIFCKLYASQSSIFMR